MVSCKSVKAKLVVVLPSQVAMVEMKRSRREGEEVAATKSSQSSVFDHIVSVFLGLKAGYLGMRRAYFWCRYVWCPVAVAEKGERTSVIAFNLDHTLEYK